MAFESRTAYEKAGIFTRCARFLPLPRLRKVIDGPPNRSDTAYTLGLLVANNIGCHLNYSGLGPADLVSFGRASQRLYDRGALLDQVIGTYAPNLELTRAQTTHPAVHMRFNQREVPRNRWREPGDYRYFEIAVCMVRLAPELSVMLVKSEPASSAQRRLQEAIIVRARLCVGNAKRVEVDQTQFRIYITDAVYRWAVAARGVDSLIPEAAE